MYVIYIKWLELSLEGNKFVSMSEKRRPPKRIQWRFLKISYFLIKFGISSCKSSMTKRTLRARYVWGECVQR